MLELSGASPPFGVRSLIQRTPAIHGHRNPPLIHLPLALPSPDRSQLTPWISISLSLSALIPLFQNLPRRQASPDGDEEDTPQPQKRRKVVELPAGGFGSVSYVRVYANCRVRRTWFVSTRIDANLLVLNSQAADGERTMEAMGQGVRDEWGLYAAEAAP